MKVLYVGGTGEISHACVARSLELGHEVTVFNRGRRSESVPEQVERVVGDLRDDTVYGELAHHGFDVVCQFLAYDTSIVERDLDLFSGGCQQYVFISTASAYEKPNRQPIVTEATPLQNPYWAYSRSKAACEALLNEADAAGRLPVTIVRPSHTYRTRFPSTLIDGDHLAWRMLNDKPVLVHDDGESLWTLTHAEDFARAFARLLGRRESLGGAFHITCDEAPSWRVILREVARALGKEARLCPVPARTLIGYEAAWEGPLLGDKASSMRFDNTRIRSVVGAWECEISLREGLSRVAGMVRARLADGYRPNPELDALIDRIIAEQSC